MITLNLIEDGRDISRLVSVTGNELRTGYSASFGSWMIYSPFSGDILDCFSLAEIDEIVDAGSEHILDAVAGTTYTVINW